MTTKHFFSKCKSPHDVHVKLKTLLCMDFLHEKKCKDYFTRFRLECQTYFVTPAEKQISTPNGILQKLEEKKLLQTGYYEKLKDLVENIHPDVIELIEEAEEKISNVEKQTVAPQRKRRGTDGSTSKSVNDVAPQRKRRRTDGSTSESVNDEKLNINKLQGALIKINNDMTEAIQLYPLQERGEEELPINLLYSSVVIREDSKFVKKGTTTNLPPEESDASDAEDLDNGSVCSDSSSTNSCTSSSSSGDSFSSRDSEISSVNMDVTDPADIFMNGDDVVRKIFMLGDAAHGKTTYCLWLLKNWCTVKQRDCSAKNLNKWEKAMEIFDFVFLLQFRNANPNLSSIKDMICKDLFESDEDYHETILYILSTNKYKSLIIMDGLDEWDPNDETKKQLRCQGIPNIYVSSTVSCFISMRPWIFARISKMVKVNDRVIDILGLSKTGLKKVIKKVLLNYYQIDKSECRCRYKEIKKKLKEKSLKSFARIPLLAVVCVQIWVERKQLKDNMTSFYGELLNMLIERAHQHNKLPNIEHNQEEDLTLPEMFSGNENIKSCISVLLRLGKVAYEGLIPEETTLVFEKIKLEKDLGLNELTYALNVGLISQRESPSLLKKNIRVHFFHKSVQEFLAAFYILCKRGMADIFRKQLADVNVILRLSNVVMFLCGMSPTLGKNISQHIVTVTDGNKNICFYRQSPPKLGNNVLVEQLYIEQAKWYREFIQTNNKMTFHISDVYLSDYSDEVTMSLSRDIMSNSNVDFKSMLLWRVSINKSTGIPNKILNQFLSAKHNKRSLEMLFIYGKDTKRYIRMIHGPHLRTLYLHHVKISLARASERLCSPLLTEMTNLRELWINTVTLGVRGLSLPSHMDDIMHIELWHINMSIDSWKQFRVSASRIRRRFDIILHKTNIDITSIGRIRRSGNFQITHEDIPFGTFNFKRIWPVPVSDQEDSIEDNDDVDKEEENEDETYVEDETEEDETEEDETEEEETEEEETEEEETEDEETEDEETEDEETENEENENETEKAESGEDKNMDDDSDCSNDSYEEFPFKIP